MAQALTGWLIGVLMGGMAVAIWYERNNIGIIRRISTQNIAELPVFERKSSDPPAPPTPKDPPDPG